MSCSLVTVPHVLHIGLSIGAATVGQMGHTVAQLVEALHYKVEGHGFNS
jgi:hypothetical protein